MYTLYIDPWMGVSEDSLAAALYDLLSEQEQSEFIKEINTLGFADILINTERCTQLGVNSLRFNITSRENGETFTNCELFSNEYDPVSPPCIEEITNIVSRLELETNIQKNMLSIFHNLIDNESKVRGIPASQIQFQDSGLLFTLVFITICCLLFDKINPENIISSAIHIGQGCQKVVNGILPIPAPSIMQILKEIPVYTKNIEEELCTLSGIAILKHFVSRFDCMPSMKVKNIGNGLNSSTKCIRVLLGNTLETKDEIYELSCNIDDMTPERIGFAFETLFEAGALDVYTIPVGMKKSRPGIVLCVACKKENKDKIIHLIFKHTTTLGIRENKSFRHSLERTISRVSTKYGLIRKKKSQGYGITKEKWEYDDLAKIAKETGLSIETIVKELG